MWYLSPNGIAKQLINDQKVTLVFLNSRNNDLEMKKARFKRPN